MIRLKEHILVNNHEKAQFSYAQLKAMYGEPEWSPCGDPVEELIGTILSANTNDTNSARAFEQLMERFCHDWDAVCAAPLDAVKEAIRPAGMYNQKAPHIVAALTHIKNDRGDYSLDHLAELDVDKALDYLTALPGVGHKTASIVLLFCFKRAAFPVDTHVQRVSQRLGISERNASPHKIQTIWEKLMPSDTYYTLHIDLIRHGRTTCRARGPKCEICALQVACDYYNGTGAWTTSHDEDKSPG